mmetsp:Transcript_53684/g.126948  ORF Transcript_53684/g.126948 Transcript_53684/m.126948 type:complete len:291 (-) Transcript_53684:204-1076(-)
MVKIEASYTLRAKGTWTAIPCRTVYQVAATGEMVLDNHCYYSPSLPPPARIGLELAVPGALNRLQWYGRGPYESYPDRLGVQVGQYSEAVEDTFVKYIVPQENGNKCETRWAALVGADGLGLLISNSAPGETFSLSAHHFKAIDLFNARHTKDVTLYKDVTVTIDHAHTATGGNTSWTRSQMPQFMIPRGSYSYSIRLSPILAPGLIARPGPLPAPLAGSVSVYKAPALPMALWHGMLWDVSLAIGHSPIWVVETILEVTSVQLAHPVVVVLGALGMIYSLRTIQGTRSF